MFSQSLHLIRSHNGFTSGYPHIKKTNSYAHSHSSCWIGQSLLSTWPVLDLLGNTVHLFPRALPDRINKLPRTRVAPESWTEWTWGKGESQVNTSILSLASDAPRCEEVTAHNHSCCLLPSSPPYRGTGSSNCEQTKAKQTPPPFLPKRKVPTVDVLCCVFWWQIHPLCTHLQCLSHCSPLSRPFLFCHSLLKSAVSV